MTKTSSLSPSQISTITDTVATKNKTELKTLQDTIDKSKVESVQAAQKCSSLKSEMTSLVQERKNDLDIILSRASNNIKKFEQSHQAALIKLQEQDEINQKIVKSIDGYNKLFTQFDERQNQIEDKLTKQGDSLIALNDKIGKIMNFLFKTNPDIPYSSITATITLTKHKNAIPTATEVDGGSPL